MPANRLPLLDGCSIPGTTWAVDYGIGGIDGLQRTSKHIIYIIIYCISKYNKTQVSPFPAPLCPDSSVKNVSVSPLCLSFAAENVGLGGSFLCKNPTKELKSCK